MKVKKIQLKKFRRFTDLTIDLGDDPKNIVALVGPNGSGKSSIFDALEEENKKALNVGQHQPEFASKSFYEEIPDKTYQRESQAIITTQGDKDEVPFQIRTAYRYTPLINVSQLKQIPDLKSENKPQNSNQEDKRLSQNYERMMGSYWSDTYGKKKTGEDWVKENVDIINNKLKNLLDIEISDLGNIVEGRGQFYFKKGKSTNFPYQNLSAGEKEVIDLIIDLVIKTKFYKNAVYCIDEPELHISTKAQRILISEIAKMIPATSQLWIATHSIGCLRALQNDLKNEVQIIDFSGGDFDSTVILKPIRISPKKWREIFQVSLDDITGLVTPELLIYCEGRKESSETEKELGLDSSVYNLIFENEFSHCIFISSGGNEVEKYSAFALDVLRKALIDTKINVLKDRDGVSDEERGRWLFEDGTRKMLKRREIENYLLDKEILKRKYSEFNETEYDKLVSDINSQDVKSIASKILKSACGEVRQKIDREFALEIAGEITTDTEIYKELKTVIF